MSVPTYRVKLLIEKDGTILHEQSCGAQGILDVDRAMDTTVRAAKDLLLATALHVLADRLEAAE